MRGSLGAEVARIGPGLKGVSVSTKQCLLAMSVSDALKVPRECFVIVPGNHDIALNDYRPTDYPMK